MVEGASRSFEAIGLKGLRFSDGGPENRHVPAQIVKSNDKCGRLPLNCVFWAFFPNCHLEFEGLLISCQHARHEGNMDL